MSTILITGGTGLIGKAITAMLVAKGHQVIILTREPAKQKTSFPDVSFASWDIEKGTIDPKAFQQADTLIHLAGANVGDKRWTEKRKQEIVDSRVKSGALLVKALSEIPNKIETVVSASAIGWYGPDTLSITKFTEDDPHFGDFLGQTCAKWEASIAPLKKRLVILRTGIVLSNDGGALPEFKRPLKFGLATILSKGMQVLSWIHIDDIARIYLHAMENKTMQGIYNAVAPEPVSNKELTITLAKQERGKFFIPVHVPSFALKIALGEMSVEVLKSSTVSCHKLQQSGFIFLYPSIDLAIAELAG